MDVTVGLYKYFLLVVLVQQMYIVPTTVTFKIYDKREESIKGTYLSISWREFFVSDLNSVFI